MPAAQNNSKSIHIIAKVDDRRMIVIDFKLGIAMVMRVDLFLKRLLLSLLGREDTVSILLLCTCILEHSSILVSCSFSIANIIIILIVLMHSPQHSCNWLVGSFCTDKGTKGEYLLLQLNSAEELESVT